MATNWDLYNARLNVNGSTARDRTINNFKTMKDKIGTDSPASKTISIENIDKSAFIDMSVFINSKTNKFEKSISPVISTDTLVLGSKIKWKNFDWLITELNLDDDVFVDSTARQCNYTLPFQNSTSTIIQEPCIVLSQSDSLSGEDTGNIITIPDTQRVVYIQYNDNTSKLIEEKRLFIDQLCAKPKVFHISKIDRMYYMQGNNGLWKLTCDEDSTVSATDRPDLMVADFVSTAPYIPPTPSMSGTSFITNTTGVIYTTSKQIKVGGSAVPFDPVFKDTLGNVVANISPKWSLVTNTEQTDKVHLTYNAIYPNRAYVQIDNIVGLIGTSFTLRLIDQNDLYGECLLNCQVVSYT